MSRLRWFSTLTPRLSAQPGVKTSVKRSILDIQKQYQDKSPITAVTAHDFITGKFANDSNVDMVLIGDSLAMVQLGYPSTNQLKFQEFQYLAQSVSRAVTSKYLISDLPFGSYESSVEKCVESSISLFQTCENLQAVKIEGGREYLDYFRKLDQIGITVCGHLGLTPQRYNYLGGYKLQGSKNLESSLSIFKTCLDLQNLGKIKMLVLECIPQSLAKIITENLQIPTIGIGAGKYCNGQILVQADLLGMGNNEKLPKFVKKYGNFYNEALNSLNKYDEEVKLRSFPGQEYSFKMSKEVYEELNHEIKKMIKNY